LGPAKNRATALSGKSREGSRGKFPWIPNENSSKERMKEKRANLFMKKSFEIISKGIVVTI
jgi:hypothetical protein